MESLRMSLHQLFKLIIRISGITCGITIKMTNDLFYFDGLFLVVVVMWMWSEFDWYRARNEKANS